MNRYTAGTVIKIFTYHCCRLVIITHLLEFFFTRFLGTALHVRLSILLLLSTSKHCVSNFGRLRLQRWLLELYRLKSWQVYWFFQWSRDNCFPVWFKVPKKLNHEVDCDFIFQNFFVVIPVRDDPQHDKDNEYNQ